MKDKIITLPPPTTKSGVSFEMALLNRRSIREFLKEPLTLEEVSQLAWSASGITSSDGLRAAPSPGGTFPIEIYLVIFNVTNIKAGIYRYNYIDHTLIFHKDIKSSNSLATASLGQNFISEAAINIVLSADYSKTTATYGERGNRYVWMEAGHIAENIHLQAASLGLGTVILGAFYDEEVKKYMNMVEEPLCIMPVGKK